MGTRAITPDMLLLTLPRYVRVLANCGAACAVRARTRLQSCTLMRSTHTPAGESALRQAVWRVRVRVRVSGRGAQFAVYCYAAMVVVLWAVCGDEREERKM